MPSLPRGERRDCRGRAEERPAVHFAKPPLDLQIAQRCKTCAPAAAARKHQQKGLCSHHHHAQIAVNCLVSCAQGLGLLTDYIIIIIIIIKAQGVQVTFRATLRLLRALSSFRLPQWRKLKSLLSLRN